MNEIPHYATLVSMSNNDDHLAVYAVTGVYTEIVVHECWLGDDGKPVTSDFYYTSKAHLYLTPDEARALAAALLKVTTTEKPDPVDGRWYWVKFESGEWFPAMRDNAAYGGWSDDVCWQDIDCEVIDWQEMVPPVEVPNAE